MRSRRIARSTCSTCASATSCWRRCSMPSTARRAMCRSTAMSSSRCGSRRAGSCCGRSALATMNDPHRTDPAPTHVSEPARTVPLVGSFDVVVLGGGPAGIAAATAAARHGVRVLLVERYGFLGGMGTAAGVTNFCGLHANVHGTIRQVVHGIADDLLARMRALDGLNEPHLIFGKIHAQAYDMSAFKCAADALVVDSGAALLFHALAAGVARAADGRIETLFVETKSGRLALRAAIFIDCSGDGEIAHCAGVPMEKGDADGHLLYPTLMFRVGNVDAA